MDKSMKKISIPIELFEKIFRMCVKPRLSAIFECDECSLTAQFINGNQYAELTYNEDDTLVILMENLKIRDADIFESPFEQLDEILIKIDNYLGKSE